MTLNAVQRYVFFLESTSVLKKKVDLIVLDSSKELKNKFLKITLHGAKVVIQSFFSD